MLVRCLHCHEPIEVPDEGDLRRVHCSACGGSFSLVGESTAPYFRGEARKLAHFELIEQAGAGAFGTVWKARDTKLDRIVAVKVPRAGRLDADEAEMFLREARAVAQLKHPNIVPVHEVGRDGDTVFIVSEYVDEVSLADLLTARKMNAREAAEFCVKVADALHHAHEAGVIHRDLKPGNIMVDKDGQPHVMDFGLARREAGEVTMTVEGKILGTPAYMSPEQARGEAHQADRRSDVYSLGVILFELLTGERPFRGSARMLLHQVIHDEAPSPRKLAASVPRDLETICLKCLEKEPGKRYRAAKDLAEDLRHHLAGESIAARPISGLSRIWRRCRRKPIVAGLSAAVLGLLLTIAIAGPLVAWRQAFLTQRYRRLLYIAEMNSARQAWDENDVARTTKLLSRWEPAVREEDLRGFEWFYLQHLTRRSKALQESFDERGPIQGGASFVSLSETDVLAVAYGESLSIRNLPTGSETTYPLKALREPPFGLRSRAISFWAFGFVAISKNGQMVVYRDDDPSVLAVRDLQSGRVIRLPGKGGVVRAAAFSPDGRRIVSGYQDGSLVLWDLLQAEVVRECREGSALVWSVAFSPVEELVAWGAADNSIGLWNLETNKGAVLNGHYSMPSTIDGVLSVAFSPDGNFLVSGGADRTVRVWDPKTRHPEWVFPGHTDEVRSVAVSRDGIIASGGRDHSIRLWDLRARRPQGILKGHDQIVQSLAFTSDGSQLISCGMDGSVLRWSNIIEGQPDVFWCDQPVTSIALSRDGSVIAATQQYSSRLRFWISQPGSERWESTVLDLNCIAEAVAMSPNQLCAVACADGSLQLRSPRSKESVTTIPGKFEGHPQADSSPFHFSPDGSRLAMGCGNGKIRLWDVIQRRELTPLECGPTRVQSLSFGYEPGELLAGCDDGKVIGWDLNKRKSRVLLDQGQQVCALAVSPNGRTLVTGGQKGINVWDRSTGRRLAPLVGGRSHYSIVFLDDQTMVSSGGELSIRIWDLEHRTLRFTLTGHGSAAWLLRASRDGRTMVSGGRDCSVRVWRAPMDSD